MQGGRDGQICPMHREKLENGELEIEGYFKAMLIAYGANSDCLV